MDMVTQDVFNKVKVEARTHTITFLIMRYEMDGISLTEEIIAQIKYCATYKEFVYGCGASLPGLPQEDKARV